MAFKLTYSDGQESEHDDDTVWEVDNGVLKLGRAEGKWTVLLSPSHWAVLELGGAKSKDNDGDGDGEKAKGKKDEKSGEDDDDDKNNKDDDEDKDKDKADESKASKDD